MGKCWCCSFKTGAIVAGSYKLAISIFGLLLIYIATRESITIILYESTKSAQFVCSIVGGVFMVLFSALMLVGITKEKPGLALPWVILVILETLRLGYSIIILSIALSALAAHTEDLVPDNIFGGVLVSLVILAGLNIFCVYGVLGYYSEHKKKIREQGSLPMQSEDMAREYPPQYPGTAANFPVFKM